MSLGGAFVYLDTLPVVYVSAVLHACFRVDLHMRVHGRVFSTISVA